MHIAHITKSDAGIRLALHDSSLSVIEAESFSDLYAANFFLQTVAKKHRFSNCLFVVHDANRNTVDLSLATDEDSIFLS